MVHIYLFSYNTSSSSSSPVERTTAALSITNPAFTTPNVNVGSGNVAGYRRSSPPAYDQSGSFARLAPVSEDQEIHRITCFFSRFMQMNQESCHRELIALFLGPLRARALCLGQIRELIHGNIELIRYESIINDEMRTILLMVTLLMITVEHWKPLGLTETYKRVVKSTGE